MLSAARVIYGFLVQCIHIYNVLICGNDCLQVCIQNQRCSSLHFYSLILLQKRKTTGQTVNLVFMTNQLVSQKCQLLLQD